MNLANKRILVTGGHGFLGRVLVKKLQDEGALVETFSSSKYNLTCEKETHHVLRDHKPEIVIHAAAKVGGILYNRKHPAELFYQNMVMGIQLMDAAYNFGVEKFVQIGTVCEYPKYTPVPFREENLWDGLPEETNAPYGIAKKALLTMGEAYRQQYGFNSIHLLPVNMYGPGDNFDPESSHVIPALIRKIVKAKKEGDWIVKVGGTGAASREFLYVEDAADAIVKATSLYDAKEPVNIGSGEEITITNLAFMIAKKVGFTGTISLNANIPDGQPRRCLDTSKAKAFGFKASTSLGDGLEKTIKWYLENK